MYKTLSKTGTVIVIVVAIFSIIQVVFPVINRTIKVREGMTSGRENSLPTLTFMTGNNQRKDGTD